MKVRELPELITSNRELTEKSQKWLLSQSQTRTPAQPAGNRGSLQPDNRHRNSGQCLSPAATRLATVMEAKLFESRRLPFRKDSSYLKYVRSHDRINLLLDEIQQSGKKIVQGTPHHTVVSDKSHEHTLICLSSSGNKPRHRHTTFELPRLTEETDTSEDAASIARKIRAGLFPYA